jgi:hypothetical protein
VQISFPADLSLHAGVSTEAHQRDKLERLCRYVSRSAVSEKRLALTSNGNIRYQLKTPYRDVTTYVIFERGGLPPNSKNRIRVTPAKRGKGRQPTAENWLDKTPAERHAVMTWMQRLKRVFNWAASGSIRRRPHRDLRAVRR